MLQQIQVRDVGDDQSSSSVYTHKTQQELFEVERVIKKKVEEGKTYYLIKWKNYSENEMTWEPMENLFSIFDLIDTFEEQQKKLRYPNYEMDQSEKGDESYDSSLAEIDMKKRRRKRKRRRTKSKFVVEKPNHKRIPIEEHKKEILQEHLKGDITFDTPHKVKNVKIQNGRLVFNICWQSRSDGATPYDELVSHDILREKFPYLLLDFYEERLMYGSKKLNVKNKSNENFNSVSTRGDDSIKTDRMDLPENIIHSTSDMIEKPISITKENDLLYSLPDFSNFNSNSNINLNQNNNQNNNLNNNLSNNLKNNIPLPSILSVNSDTPTLNSSDNMMNFLNPFNIPSNLNPNIFNFLNNL